MATKQTIDHFSKYSKELLGPILEIGSLINLGYEQFLPKDIHSEILEDTYVGIDIFQGEGVDYVVDITKKGALEMLPFKKFKTIHCHYVMEHVPNIFEMAKSIEKLLDVNGVLLISVPISWKLHRIPVDMWRFTPQSIDYLFPNIDFVEAKSAIHTRKGSVFYGIHEIPELNLGTALNKYPFLFKLAIKTLRKLRIDKTFFTQRALLQESNLMMYGIKKENPTYNFIDKSYIN
ncbi:hypothetical protein DI383_02170 [Flavobacteriaceae bacterium LYZ1037]|nr:hypothetical protein DI383_02170 [Flavobacteriaceae bacterium LYZ1037]